MALGELPPADTWRLKAVMPNGTVIPFKLVDGYPKGSIEEETGEITEQYIIEAKWLLAFICYSFSKQQAWPGLPNWVYRPPRAYRTVGDVEGGGDDEVRDALGGMVTRKIAFEMYPVGRPGDPFLCDAGETIYEPGVGDVAVGGPEDDTYAQYVLVTITYGPGKATEISGETRNEHDLLQVTANASGEFILESSNSRLEWASQGAIESPLGIYDEVLDRCKEANVSLSKVVPGVEWVVKFKRVPFAKMSAIADLLVGLLGKVNSNPIHIFNDAEAETVLFMGFNYNMMFSWRSKCAFSELDLKFMQRRINVVSPYGTTPGFTVKGWNHFWSPEHQLWLRLWKEDEANTDMYKTADLDAQIFGGQGVWV